MIANVLSIAGSDPSGGAGVQADLKTFAALGTYGMAAITALTVQNTRGVRRVEAVARDLVVEQVRAVFEDVRVDAVKIGLLPSEAVVLGVADALAPWRGRVPVVLDPVLVATSGDRLASSASLEALRDLVRTVDLVTPNVSEAAALLGVAPATVVDEQTAQGVALHERGPAVLLKGGHLPGAAAVDVFVGDGRIERLDAPWVDTSSTHGTGCTLSSAVAALRPRHDDWLTTCAAAKAYTHRAIVAGADLDVGHGHGPLRHDVENASYDRGSQGPPR